MRSVYTQDDVTNFAKVVTGWSGTPPRQDPERAGEFQFNPRMHEPGAQSVIGKSYPEPAWSRDARCWPRSRAIPQLPGMSQPNWSRHFIADDPPPALVQGLAKRFLETDGNLKELAKALVTAPEAWQPTRAS